MSDTQTPLDRLHAEIKSFRVEQATLHERIAERLLILEHGAGHMEQRLNEGARTFTEIQAQLRPSVSRVAAFILAAITAVGLPIAVFLYKLGRYPDADAFTSQHQQQEAYQRTTSERIQRIELHQVEQDTQLSTIRSATLRMEDKLDQVLSRRR